jgi:hypothetical protein
MNVQILSEVNQNDGRKAVQVTYTTSLGDCVSKSFLISASVNSLDYAITQEASILNQLKQNEMIELEVIINTGELSINDIASNLKYVSIAETLTSIIERGVTLTSVYRLTNLKNLTDYIKANFTNEQLITVTGYEAHIIDLYYKRVSTSLTCVDAINELEGSAING